MRILMINNVFPPRFLGGYELAALEVVNYLVSKNHTLEILTSDYLVNCDENEAPLGEFRVIRSLQMGSMRKNSFNSRSGDTFLNLWNIRQISSSISDFKPDLIMLWNIQNLGAFGILKMIEATGIPSCLHLMDDVFAGSDLMDTQFLKFETKYGKAELPQNMKIFCMSENLKNEITLKYGLNMDGTLFIPGWVDNPTPLETSRKLESKSSCTKFVFSSRIAGHKGIYLVIEAANKLVKMNLLNFSIDIYGNGDVENVMKLVHANGLDNIVRYRGTFKKSEALVMLSNYDALLFPTWQREPFGFIAIEAAAAGCIPIITNGIGASEWLVNNLDSVKINPTAEDLTDAMQRFMQMDKTELAGMKAKAIERAKSNFDFQKWMSVLESSLTNHQEDFACKTLPSIFQIERALAFLDPYDRSETVQMHLPEVLLRLKPEVLLRLKQFFVRLPTFMKRYIKRKLLY